MTLALACYDTFSLFPADGAATFRKKTVRIFSYESTTFGKK